MQNKKTVLTLSLTSIIALSGAFVLVGQSKLNNVRVFGDGNTVWKHYDAVDKTSTTHGSREFWANCTDLGNHVLIEPTGDTIIESEVPFNQTPYFADLDIFDDRYIMADSWKGYQISDETAWNKAFDSIKLLTEGNVRIKSTYTNPNNSSQKIITDTYFNSGELMIEGLDGSSGTCYAMFEINNDTINSTIWDENGGVFEDPFDNTQEDARICLTGFNIIQAFDFTLFSYSDDLYTYEYDENLSNDFYIETLNGVCLCTKSYISFNNDGTVRNVAYRLKVGKNTQITGVENYTDYKQIDVHVPERQELIRALK